MDTRSRADGRLPVTACAADHDELPCVLSAPPYTSHPSQLGARLSTSDDDVRHTARDPHVDGHVAAHADWWALSRCDDLVLTRHSTFGYTAAGLSGRVPLTAFEHKVERRFHCGPFDLCDMHPPELA